MVRDIEESQSASTAGRTGIDWRHGLATLAMTGSLFFLILWNLFLLALTFVGMPRNDFGRPLLAARAFLAGQDMYGMTDGVAYRLDHETVIHLWNLNPPHSQLVYLPLAGLSDASALAAWHILGGLCLYATIRIILSEIGLELTGRGKEWLAFGLLAFTGTGTALVMAHITFPLTLLMTMAWRDARHGRWGASGCWLGLILSTKPFLLIFIPYLILTRRWRGLAAVGGTTALAFLLGVTVFGVESHRSWLLVLSEADSWTWLPNNASLHGFLSRTLMDNALFTPLANLNPGLIRFAWLALGIPMGLVTLIRSMVDPSVRQTDRAFAILSVTALLLSPLGWIYYFWLPVGPIAALARGWCLERSGRRGDGLTTMDRTSRCLFLASMVGMVCPALFPLIWQPLPLATVLIASFHFWSLGLLWLALILDGVDLRAVRDESASIISMSRGSLLIPNSTPVRVEP